MKSNFAKRIICFDHKRLIDLFVDTIEEKLESLTSNNFRKPIGLATGRTMAPVYKSLVLRLNSWPKSRLERLRERWISFNLDEYIGLPNSDPRNFRSFMLNNLVRPLGLSDNKIVIPNSEALDPYKEASNFLSKLNQFGGTSFQILGLGNNGHIGFNEPPCEVESTCRVVNLSLTTRYQNNLAFGGDINNVPSMAITLGIKEILASEEIHLIVTGTEKADILKKFITSPITNDLPASWLKQHNRLFLWVDELAMMKIDKASII